MKKNYTNLLILFLAGLAFTAHAEDGPEQYCNAAIELHKEGDIEGALEEARWCVESLEQLAQAQQKELFSIDIDGWKRGKVNQQKTMGISIIETTYTKEGKSIDVNLTSGAAAGMGALAMISQLGMAQAGNKVRIQRRTAIVNESDNKTEVMIGLTQGGMLNFTSTNADRDTVIAFAKLFPINELDQ